MTSASENVETLVKERLQLKGMASTKRNGFH